MKAAILVSVFIALFLALLAVRSEMDTQQRIDSIVLASVVPNQIDSTAHTHRWDCSEASIQMTVVDSFPPMVCHKGTCKCLDCGADSSYHWDETIILVDYPVAPAPKAVTHCPPHDWCWGDTAWVNRPRIGIMTYRGRMYYEAPGICRTCLAETTATWRVPPLTEYEKLKGKKDGK